jgi:hypothetical protein
MSVVLIERNIGIMCHFKLETSRFIWYNHPPPRKSKTKQRVRARTRERIFVVAAQEAVDLEEVYAFQCGEYFCDYKGSRTGAHLSSD